MIQQTPRGLIKKFADGFWVGNSAPLTNYGIFNAQSGYHGIFVDFIDGEVYVVTDSSMKTLASGEAVAMFGG